MVAELLTELFTDRLPESLLVGLGNPLRRDDGVGPYLAEELAKLSGIRSENAGDRPERAIDFAARHRPRQLVFLDAADFGGRPGELRRIDPSELSSRSLSSHRLPLPALIAWIEAEYPTRCFCLGIQAVDMQLGEGLTPAVAATTAELLDWFARRLEMERTPPVTPPA
ncbi:hydrogenase maturation protease [Geothermobacter hydrogeniphilus]|uniref:hydrogenase maturation protease n=1 Tax=Geothermobacter hydrogeniphilus TaxID=1969733 RepID=UPI001555EE2F|nr:hydrogenase maturation protease [Geothermobacter hydrogeniphilus]